VRPVSIVRTSGSVTNPGALTQGTGSTVLTTSSTSSPATVVVDFGKEVGGTPFATVSSSGSGNAADRHQRGAVVPDGQQQRRLQQRQRLGDQPGGQRGPDLHRVAAGRLPFAAIQLTTTGTLTLTAAGVNFKAYRATADKYQGWFMSNDDQLNRMWFAGAYTAQMDMVPAGVASCFTVPVIFDGAKRDRAIWSGDLMVTDPVVQLSLGSNSVPYVKGSMNSILNLQGSSGRLTSAVGFRGCGAFDYANTYSAYSAILPIQYYRYTGDTAYITSVRSKLEAATAYHATKLDATACGDQRPGLLADHPER
jgi:hypothetical protein